MKHFVLMRWNLPSALHYSSLELISDAGWQARRRQLFARYCLPSLVRQTARDFTLLLFVYPDAISKADLGWFRSQDERLQVVPVGDATSTGIPEAREAVTSLASGEDWIITTRLDSDDVLHRDHLRKVRVGYEGEHKVVEFSRGFYYDLMHDELRHVSEQENAFVSLIEPAEGARTAWAWPHHRISEENEIVYLDEPGWIALVHDRNTTTYLWGERVPRDRKRAVLTEFEITRPPYALARMRRTERLARRVIRVATRRIPGRR
jgi:Putative rhamnosyl transferase